MPFKGSLLFDSYLKISSNDVSQSGISLYDLLVNSFDGVMATSVSISMAKSGQGNKYVVGSE